MPGWWTPSRQAYAYNFLVSRGGLSSYGAAGLISRWVYVEASDGPTAVNPSSGAFGIAQWLGSRKRGIYPNTNFDAQLAYVIAELQRPESTDTGIGYGLLRSANDADAAAVGATMYERAEGYREKRPRDNHTARTAAGVPSVLAAIGATPVSAGPGNALASNAPPSLPNPTNTVLVVALVGGAALLLLLLTD